MLGQSLPGHVCDATGRVLVRAGEILTQNHLQLLGIRLITGVYGGEGWGAGAEPEAPESVTPASVMQDLFQRHGGTKAAENQRSYARHKWTVPLTVELEEVGQYAHTRRTIQVSTVDISRGGFAFVFKQYVAPGAIVRAQFDSLPKRPRLEGLVTGCVLLGGNQHRVGVQFTQAKRSDKPGR